MLEYMNKDFDKFASEAVLKWLDGPFNKTASRPDEVSILEKSLSDNQYAAYREELNWLEKYNDTQQREAYKSGFLHGISIGVQAATFERWIEEKVTPRGN